MEEFYRKEDGSKKSLAKEKEDYFSPNILFGKKRIARVLSCRLPFLLGDEEGPSDRLPNW